MSDAVERARELAAQLRSLPEATGSDGACAVAAHELLARSGLYAMLVPASDGGLGLGHAGFLDVVSELARGCPASAWCAAALALGSARARALFGLDAGAERRCVFAAAGDARASAGEGGWLLSGTFARAAGARFATHVLGVAAIEGEGEPGVLRFLAHGEQYELLDGGACGCAATVRFEQALIPESFALLAPAPVDAWEASVPAAALAAVFAGAAARAAEVHEQIVRAAPATRMLDPDHQRWLGAAMARATAAAALLREAAAADSEGLRLGALARQSMRYGWDGVQETLRGANAASREQRDELERIAHFMLGGLSDPAAPAEEFLSRQLARERLELALDAALPVP